ncbi:hypothetical protein [Polaromonas jejuensis]|uniref:DUF1269 domain-containing protein n=1 Tax=Polaromonas jejuensis TaxID=457502 RepID=A0ABW0Q6K2_9BURK|nr:hypothetical protein [Polaromonas jejuensis]
MSRRIYWLIPDVASARRTVDDLLLARVPVQHIHCVGREGVNLSGLHPANVLQTTDVIYAAEAGLLIGGTLGIAAGLLVAMYYPIAIGGSSLQWGMVAVLGVLGALFGAWSSSMIGVSVPSHRLKRFEAAVEQGQILLMVDVPGLQVKAIEALLQASHPEAHFEGEDPDTPVFP